jgi:hypothetical protein
LSQLNGSDSPGVTDDSGTKKQVKTQAADRIALAPTQEAFEEFDQVVSHHHQRQGRLRRPKVLATKLV